MNNLFLSTFILIFSTLASAVEFSRNVNPEHVNSLTNDLKFLDTIIIENSTNKSSLSYILDLDKKTNSLPLWLNERVKFIVESAFDNEYSESNSSRITMTNLGAYYSHISKYENVDFEFNFKSNKSAKKLIPLSPRVGIVQIGYHLFSDNFRIDKIDINSKVNSIQRLSVLMHEARHSDGKDEYLGFKHVECPTGHDFEGRLACDEAINAGYNIAAETIKKLLKECSDDCSTSKIQQLRLLALDNKYRIIKEDVYWDPTPLLIENEQE